MLLVNVDLGDVTKTVVFPESTDALAVIERFFAFGAALSFAYGPDPGALRATKPLFDLRAARIKAMAELRSATRKLEELRAEKRPIASLRSAGYHLAFCAAVVGSLA